MLEIGINTNNDSGRDDVEILNNVAKAGFGKVMLSFRSENIEDTIEIIHNLGLEISYFHIDSKDANDLWTIGESVESYVDKAIKQIELCGKHNIPIAIMHSASGSPTDLPLKPNKQGLKNFKKILKVYTCRCCQRLQRLRALG